MSKATETPEQALARIKSMGFGQNDAMAIMYFDACGIPADEIDPKHNVLTFNAWKGAGRSVAKGATGCTLTVWIPRKGKEALPDDASDKEKAAGGMFPKTTRVFHISQTIPADAEGIKVSKDGTVKQWPTIEGIPAGWNNPALFKEDERELYRQAVERLSVEPWTEETTLEQVESEMAEVLTGEPQPAKEFSGPTIRDITPKVEIVSEEVLTLDENGELVPDEPEDDSEKDYFGAMGDDRPEGCNCVMVGCVTNAACPLHGDRKLAKVG